MSISRDDVAHIARLARLDLTAAETDGLARDLAQILEYVGRIAALETAVGVPDATGGLLEEDSLARGVSEPVAGIDSTTGAAGTAAGTPEATPFREDVIRPSLPVEEALRPSADHDGAFFRVPPVIDRDEA
jgi:aspartyl-tRNA(Asn)/glutamyl-tRNA(Gln) amidotransferase subunit C